MGTLRTRLLLREMLSVIVERMPERAGGYDPDDPDVSRKSKRSSSVAHGGGAPQKPLSAKKVPDFADPAKSKFTHSAAEDVGLPELTYNTMQSWPKDAKKVPYEKSEGVGPGEKRLAKILSGTVMGGSATFDLKTPYGKFEVKEPTGGIHGGVRVESEGIAALEANLTKIKEVAKKIDSTFGTSARPEMLAAAKEMYPAEIYQKITDFATKPETKGQTAIQWILRGEIGAKRLQALADTLLLISSGLMAESVIRLSHHVQRLMAEEKYVELGDTQADVAAKKTVDTSTYVQVGKALDMSPEQMKVTPADLLRAQLNHEAFTAPDAFINSVVSAPVKASQVFGHTDGLILVQPDGYMIIPRSELDQKMQFLRISKGKPYFKLSGGKGGEED